MRINCLECKNRRSRVRGLCAACYARKRERVKKQVKAWPRARRTPVICIDCELPIGIHREESYYAHLMRGCGTAGKKVKG